MKSDLTAIFKKERIFKFNPEIPENHASTIAEMPNGDLLVAWFGGSEEGNKDLAIYSSRLPKGTNEWTKPEIIADTKKQPDQNPLLFVDRKRAVWLFYVTFGIRGFTKGQYKSIIMYKKSFDNGFSWTEPEKLRPREGLWVRNVPIILKNNDIVLPFYDNKTRPNCCYVMISEDDGETWETYGPITTVTGCAQGNVVQLSDGSLLMYMRTRSHPLHQFISMPQYNKIEYSPGRYVLKRESFAVGGYVWMSTSNDEGRTWSSPVETSLRNPNSGISLIRLNNGNLVLAFNDTHIGRSPLNIALSTDEGKTWSYRKTLESGEGEYSYPQLMQTSDGLIHVVYTNRRMTIKHAVFNEEWIKKGNSE